MQICLYIKSGIFSALWQWISLDYSVRSSFFNMPSGWIVVTPAVFSAEDLLTLADELLWVFQPNNCILYWNNPKQCVVSAHGLLLIFGCISSWGVLKVCSMPISVNTNVTGNETLGPGLWNYWSKLTVTISYHRCCHIKTEILNLD